MKKQDKANHLIGQRINAARQKSRGHGTGLGAISDDWMHG